MMARQWIHRIALLTIAMVTACSEPPPAADVAARPVKTQVVEAIGGSGVREFPGRIDANRQAELSFAVPGKVIAIHIKEGDQVADGQLLAEIDSTDYRIALSDAQAQFDNARKNYLRGRELVNQGAISKMDFDRMEATYKSAKAGLEAAQQALEYTRLAAPFPGVIARRHVDKFEEVVAKQKIFTLQDVETLEVKVDVPERIVRRLKRSKTAAQRAARTAATRVAAYFPQQPDDRYPLRLKEVSTEADPATQTFEATFTMAAPQQMSVLPGMSVSVRADLSAQLGKREYVLIPAGAVGANPELAPQVWVVDEQTLTVEPRAVTVGELEGNQIQVLSGLTGGERIVTAGIGALIEGMPVTLMPGGEQAEPRAGPAVGQ